MDLTSEPAVADLQACLTDGHVFPLIDTRRYEMYGTRLVERPEGLALVSDRAELVGGGFTCARCKTTFDHPHGEASPGVA